MHTRYFQVGGVFEDIPLGFEQQPARLLRRDAVAARPVRGDPRPQRDLPQPHAATSASSRGSGCSSSGSPGPLLRAAGEPWDLRKVAPYLAYEDFDFNIPVGTVGDGYDRYRVRMAEMRESVKIVEQALDGLPEGPHIADDRKVVLPPRDELATSMEALIHHFKLVTEGFRVPPGEIYYAIESPRGELGCFVVADGSAKPARVHFRDPSFVNLQSLRDMCLEGYVADLIQNLAMLDPILGRHRPVSERERAIPIPGARTSGPRTASPDAKRGDAG